MLSIEINKDGIHARDEDGQWMTYSRGIWLSFLLGDEETVRAETSEMTTQEALTHILFHMGY